MPTETSNIDDVLMGGKTALHPETPENQYQSDSIPGLSDDTSDDAPTSDYPDIMDNSYTSQSEKDEALNASPTPEQEGKELDDYGTEKPKPRMYTEEEKNAAIQAAIKKRFKDNNEQQTQPQTQQVQQVQQEVAKDFEYNPDSDIPWEQQFEQMVEKSITNMSQRQARKQQELLEQQEHKALSDRFTHGMNRFADFEEVVGGQPMTDHMTIALRAIEDPAAFVYAASKLHPKELERISKLNPTVQIVEMGRLEERMRRKPGSTNAPKPIARTKEDGTFKEKPKEQGDSIENMIAQAEARKLAKLKARRGR